MVRCNWYENTSNFSLCNSWLHHLTIFLYTGILNFPQIRNKKFVTKSDVNKLLTLRERKRILKDNIKSVDLIKLRKKKSFNAFKYYEMFSYSVLTNEFKSDIEKRMPKREVIISRIKTFQDDHINHYELRCFHCYQCKSYVCE